MGQETVNIAQDASGIKERLSGLELVDKANEHFFSGRIVEAKEMLSSLATSAGTSAHDSVVKLRAIAQLLRIHTEASEYEDALKLSLQAQNLEKDLLSSGEMVTPAVRRALSLYYYERAIFDFSRCHYATALSFARASEKMAPQVDLDQVLRALYSQATVLANTGDLVEAESLIVRIESTAGDRLASLESFIQILKGEISRFRGDINSALPFYEKALHLQKGNKNGKVYHSILLCIAKCYKRLKHFEKARMFLDLADTDIDIGSFRRFNKMVLLEHADLAIDVLDYERCRYLLEVLEHDLPENFTEASDLYLFLVYGKVKFKLVVGTGQMAMASHLIKKIKSAAALTSNPVQMHLSALKEAQWLIANGQSDQAFLIVEKALEHFESKGLYSHQVTALSLLVQMTLERQRFDQLKSLLQKKMAIEIRFAYYRNYVQSSLLMTVAMRKCQETGQTESILLNALKVAHRVNLPAERAAIYKLLGEEENFKREFNCLDHRGRQQVEYFIRDYDVNELLDFDIVIDQNTNTVIHKELGTISFGNKFTLMKILVMLAEKHGASVGKEALSERLWGRAYNPIVDDNTIYIHMNRLRRVLELEPSKPKLILNTHNGYQLNVSIRLKIIPFVGKLQRDRFPKMAVLIRAMGPVTSKKVQDHFKISKATAARELVRWVEEGKILRHFDNGQFTYSLPKEESSSSTPPVLH